MTITTTMKSKLYNQGAALLLSLATACGASESARTMSGTADARGGAAGTGSASDTALGAEALRTAERARVGTAVKLGIAGNFVILAKSGISTVPKSAITGDIGVSPAAASYITGFWLFVHSGAA